MAKEPDYDKCYRILDLEPGAPLQDIEDSWKLHANAWHPDKFVGSLKDKANRKMQDINNARDDLKAYWKTHGKAPPTRASQQARKEPPPPPPEPKPEKQPPPPPPPEAKKEPPPPPPEFKPKPFGPPPFSKNLWHRFYDFLERQGSDSPWTMLLFIPIVFAAVIPAALVLRLVSALTGIPFEDWSNENPHMLVLTALIAFNGVTLFRILFADEELYKVQQNPYLEAKRLPLATVLERVAKVLKESEYLGCRWSVGAAARDPEDGSMTIRATMDLKNQIYHAIDASYSITLTLKVLDTSKSDITTVCYWFDVKAPTFWKSPVAKAVSQTNKALSDCLNEP